MTLMALWTFRNYELNKLYELLTTDFADDSDGYMDFLGLRIKRIKRII